jgi:tripartite-type tricarboxylate transporter receptor subunit TctC
MWMAILGPVTAPPPVRAGKIKAYAVTAMTHLPAAPDVPTVDEAGLPGRNLGPQEHSQGHHFQTKCCC